jgi:hypothetical protein
VTEDEPQKVVEARKVLDGVNRGMIRYGGAVVAAFAALVGIGAAGGPEGAVGIGVIALVAVSLGALPWRGIVKAEAAQNVVKEWDGRALRAEFDRFDEVVVDENEPRLQAAMQVGKQVQALTATDPDTDAMVDALMVRMRRLVADHTTASAAVDALKAAGAGSTGTERLAAAASRIDEEIGRILDGLSELYASLLEVEQGRAATTDTLGAVRDWLAAEAEIARSAQEAEAMRPAKGSKAGPAREEA